MSNDSTSAEEKEAIRRLLEMSEQHADWTCVMEFPNDDDKKLVQPSVEMSKQHAELTRLKVFPNEGIEQLLLKPRSHLFHYLFLVERFLEMHGCLNLPSDEHHKKIMYEIAADCHVQMFAKDLEAAGDNKKRRLEEDNKKRRLEETFKHYQDASTSKPDHMRSGCIKCMSCGGCLKSSNSD